MSDEEKKEVMNNATSEQIKQAKEFAKECSEKEENPPSTSVAASASASYDTQSASADMNYDNDSNYEQDTDLESGDEVTSEACGINAELSETDNQDESSEIPTGNIGDSVSALFGDKEIPNYLANEMHVIQLLKSNDESTDPQYPICEKNGSTYVLL